MARKMWFLVELLSKNDTLPSYKVVMVKTSQYDPSQMQPGHEMMINCRKNERKKPYLAKIISVSDNKKCIDDQKKLLEHQNEQFKTIVKLSMQTFRPSIASPEAGRREVHRSRCRKRPRPVHKAYQRDGGSDTELPARMRPYQPRNRKLLIPRRKATAIKTIVIDDSGSEPEVRKNARHKRNREIKPKAVRSSLADSSSDCERELMLYNEESNKALPTYAMEFGKLKNGRRAPWVSSTPVMNDQKVEETGKETQHIIERLNYYKEEAKKKGPQKEEDLWQDLNDIKHIIKNLDKLYGTFMKICKIAKIDINDLTTDTDSSDDDASSDFDHYEYDYKTEPSNLSHREESPDHEGEDSDGDSDTPLSELKDRMSGSLSPIVRRITKADDANVLHASLPSNDKDMSPIGNGHAKVPTRLLNNIDWTSHTAATKHLLQAIFPRSVLGTHFLTGQQASFMKPAPKKVLDPKLVEDIVKTVSTKCEVPELTVRNNITLICVDEAKLYRNRQKLKVLQGKGDLINNENRPPVAASAM